jgi:hypothetical protein
MSMCVACRGKGRACDLCGYDLPDFYVQDGDKDFCNDPIDGETCWEKYVKTEGEK